MRSARVSASFAVLLLMAACGGAGTSSAPPMSTDTTPTNPASGPRPSADSPDQGGAGGPSVGDAIGTGGITGGGAP